MAKSKLSTHFHWMDNAVASTVNSEYVKVMDPGEQNPFTQCKAIARWHMSESQQDEMILKGAPGGRDLFNFLKPRVDARPWVYAVEAWNEPLAMGLFDPVKRALLVEATIEFLRLAHQAGWRVVWGNFSVGQPPKEAWKQFAKIVQNMGPGDMLGLHEYGWPRMDAELDAANPGEGWWCLRYRKVARWLAQAGVRMPRTIINECGIDRLLVAKEPGGWMATNGNRDVARQSYFDQLVWYDRELAKDDYIVVATPFTAAAGSPWETYNIDLQLAAMVHNHIATADVSVETDDYIDLVDSLPKHPELKYKTRKLSQIQRIVIHHSATVQAEVSREATIRHIKSIAQGHIEDNDWPGIAYHFCIGPGGLVYQTNRLETVSYHVGNHNTPSVGICLLGDFTRSNPTENQLASARALVKRLGWPAVPHKALNQTKCPGDWEKWGHLITSDPPVVEPPVIPEEEEEEVTIVDERIKDFVTVTQKNGDYHVTHVDWKNEQEANGLHHIFIDVIDQDGKRMPGEKVTMTWPGGSSVGVVEEKPGEPFGANFPMNAALGSYSAFAGTDPENSDRVHGMGLGTPEHPDVFAHTCFELVFVKGAEIVPPVVPDPEPDPEPEPEPDLAELRAKLAIIRAKTVELLALIDEAVALAGA